MAQAPAPKELRGALEKPISLTRTGKLIGACFAQKICPPSAARFHRPHWSLSGHSAVTQWSVQTTMQLASWQGS